MASIDTTNFTQGIVAKNIYTENVQGSNSGALTLTSTSGNVNFSAGSSIVDFNSSRLTEVTNPTDNQDAATKIYTDTIASIIYKQEVLASTAVNLDSNASISGSITYNSTGGTSGRGQITATLNVSDTFTINNITFTSADNGSRILVKDQTTQSQNGIYTTTISGTSLTLDRSTDFDGDDDVKTGIIIPVRSIGEWSLTTSNPIVVGGASGSNLTFSQYSTNSTYGDGVNIDLSTNTVALDLKTDGGLTIDTNQLTVDINGTTSETTTVSTADFALVYDASAAALRSVLLGNLAREYTYAFSTITATTTSTTATLVPGGFTFTPAAGTYYIHFSSHARGSANNVICYIAFRVNTTTITETIRTHQASIRGLLGTMYVTTFNGTDTLDVVYATNGVGGTMTLYERNIFFVKI